MYMNVLHVRIVTRPHGPVHSSEGPVTERARAQVDAEMFDLPVDDAFMASSHASASAREAHTFRCLRPSCFNWPTYRSRARSCHTPPRPSLRRSGAASASPRRSHASHAPPATRAAWDTLRDIAR